MVVTMEISTHPVYGHLKKVLLFSLFQKQTISKVSQKSIQQLLGVTVMQLTGLQSERHAETQTNGENLTTSRAEVDTF